MEKIAIYAPVQEYNYGESFRYNYSFDVIKDSNNRGYIDGKEIEKKAADASKK